MKVWQGYNCAYHDYPGYNDNPLPTPEDGDIIASCILVRYADGPLFPGVKNLLFMNSNIINCVLDKSCEADEFCNTAKIKYEFEEEA